MAKFIAPNSIKKNYKELKEIQTEAKVKEQKLRAWCPHQTEDGDIRLRPKKSATGKYVYYCKECGKEEIDFTTVSAVDRQEAIKTIVNLMDLVKISLNLKNEKDRDLLKDVARAQDFVENKLDKLVDSAIQRQNKGKRSSSEDMSNRWEK